MGDQPRYQTLRDYLRVIRAQRWLIALFVVAFALAAFAFSARQQEEYEAEASIAFKDPSQDLDPLGLGGLPRQTPEQRAAISSERATRTAVAQRVKRELRSPASVEALQSAVSAQAEARTNLVVVTARSSNAEFAARLANEFARQAARLATEEERERYAEAERSVRRSYRDARREARRDGVPLSEFTQSNFVERLSRLQLLRDFAEAAEISQLAEVPSNPVAPQPVRNTILGIILGLALGLLAAFIRDALDVRLRGAREIQAQVKLPLLGHVGEDAMGSAGLASRNGARKLSAADMEAFRILRTNLEFLDIDSPLRAIAVTSALPEEGKSTVAASLAAAFAEGGSRTLLVECDLRRPALGERLGLKRVPGLADYLAERVGPQEILQPVELSPTNGAKRGSNGGDGLAPPTRELVCITAGTPTPRPADILASQRFRDFLAQVREAYDIVILDTSPLLSVSDTLELLPHVDGFVLCVRAGRTRRDEARAARAALEHLPERPAGLVVTGIKPGDETDYGYYSSTYAYGAVEGS